MPIFSWLKGSPEQSASTTSTDSFADLVNKMSLASKRSDLEDTYKAKYRHLRKQVDEDEIYNSLRSEITSLQNNQTAHETKYRDLDKAKTSADMQLFTVDLVLKDTHKYYKAQLDAKETENKALRHANEKLRKDKRGLKNIIQSHGVALPTRFSSLDHAQVLGPESVPELTDSTDMDEADEFEESETEDSGGVCPQWYNQGTCSRVEGNGSAKCQLGAHPRLVDFRTPAKQ